MTHPFPRAHRSGRLLALLLICSLFTACPSISTLHTARPVPEGELEYSLAFGLYAFDDEDDGDDDGYLPLVEGQVRKGLADRLDGGFKVTSLSMLQLDLNYALVLDEHFALSVDPTIAVLPAFDAFVSYLWLPVLVDVYSSDEMTLTFVGRVGYLDIDDLEEDDDTFGFDRSTGLYGFGVSSRLRFSEGLTVMPEVHFLRASDDDFDGDSLISFSVGFLL